MLTMQLQRANSSQVTLAQWLFRLLCKSKLVACRKISESQIPTQIPFLLHETSGFVCNELGLKRCYAVFHWNNVFLFPCACLKIAQSNGFFTAVQDVDCCGLMSFMMNIWKWYWQTHVLYFYRNNPDDVCQIGEFRNEPHEEQIILLFKGIWYLFTDYFVIT